LAEEVLTPDEKVDATNQYIADKWDDINQKVDAYFTNKRSRNLQNKSSVFVYSSVYKKEGQKLDNKFDFQLKFDLPNTTDKLKIIIEKEQDDLTNAISDPSVSNNKTVTKNGKAVQQKDSHYEAGANYFFRKSQSFMSSIHFGIRIDMPLNPSLKLDLQKDIKTKIVNVNLLQKVNYYRQEGLENISQMILNKRLTKYLQVDFLNSLVWSDQTDALILRQALSFSQEIGDEKVITYSAGANFRFRPAYYYESYDTSVSYRQLLYSNWLYGAWTAGADFPKDTHFHDEKFVQFRVDIYFKDKTEITEY
jgi:hypothetical protein